MCRCHNIIYIKSPKDSTKNLLEPINEFRKGYRINIQKSIVFLYTNNDQNEKLRKQSETKMEAQVDTLYLLTQPKEGQQQFKNKNKTTRTDRKLNRREV